MFIIMNKKIISEIANRDAFFHLLGHNPGLIILKLGASWCGPCHQIKHIVNAFFVERSMIMLTPLKIC